MGSNGGWFSGGDVSGTFVWGEDGPSIRLQYGTDPRLGWYAAAALALLYLVNRG